MLEFPKYLSIQTTSLCNASCVFCPYEEIKDIFPPKIMDMALYQKIINECADYRQAETIILYMNNEPLTDPYLIERINYAKEKLPWARVHILTNGALLTEEMQDKLINSKLDWIGISFQGIRKETIERTMSIPYEPTLKRINNFIEKVKTKKDIKDYLMLTFLRHRYLTPQEKQEAINFWKAKGIERISYFEGPVSRVGNVKDLPKVCHGEKIVGCNSIWADQMLHIVEDGKVVLCCMDWRREVVLGDLNKENIHQVWNGQRAKTWEEICGQEDMPEKFLCRKCEEAKLEPKKEKNRGGSSHKDLLLIATPPWQTKMVPLGLAYLSSFLSSQEVRVEIMDLNAELFNNCSDDKKYFWDIATINNLSPLHLTQKFIQAFNQELGELIEAICNSTARLIGFSTTIASVNIAVCLGHQIKMRDPSKIIILGGPGCFWNTESIDPEKIIDLFVVGEGELPLLTIVRRFKNSNSPLDLLGIQGTVVCIDKIYNSFLPPNPIKNIDQIPYPKFLEFNLKNYNRSSGYKPLPLLISRGCINRCSFCVDHKMNFPFRQRSPSSVIEEIKFHINSNQVKEFEFNDLLCNGNLKQLEQICDLIISENLDIRWSSYAAIRRGMSPELFKKMRKAGCRYICYGMESASDLVLKKMNKTYDSKLAEQVVRDTHNSGIETAINIIIGHPGESEKEFKNTRDFIKRNRDYVDQVTNVSTCFLIPETDLIKNPANYGVYFKKTLKNYLKLIFTGQKPPPDYRAFYSYDNSPSARARRTRKCLNLINRLNIPYAIVNYEKEYDLNLNKFIDKIGKNVNVLKSKDIRLDFSQKGRCKIYYKNEELTEDVGMNTSFNIDQRWIDSSSARWKIKSLGRSLDINVEWLDLPIVQNWRIKFEGKDIISWLVNTHFKDEFNILQHKIGVMVSNKYNKYIVKEKTSDFPGSFTNDWDEILFSNIPELEFTSDSFLPLLTLRAESKSEIFTQLQNTPFSLQARMVNFCSPNKGSHFSKGDILQREIKIYLRNAR